jgi:hypothetical protein
VVLALAGLYLLVLGGATIYGAVKTGGAAPDPNAFDMLRNARGDGAKAYPHDALDLGALSYVLAGACVVVGIGLLARMDAARYAFQVVAPLGALALASVFARKYWTEDLPETVLLGLPFGLLVFALGRRGSISAATLDRDETAAPPSTAARGLGWALALLAVAFLAYFAVKNNKPLRTRGYGARGYANHMDALNNHVKHLAVTYVLLWHAIPGLLAAAIPFAVRTRGRAAAEDTPPTDRLASEAPVD